MTLRLYTLLATANGMHSKPLLALFGVLNRKNEMRAARYGVLHQSTTRLRIKKVSVLAFITAGFKYLRSLASRVYIFKLRLSGKVRQFGF